jgi:hypothetical protein
MGSGFVWLPVAVHAAKRSSFVEERQSAVVTGSDLARLESLDDCLDTASARVSEVPFDARAIASPLQIVGNARFLVALRTARRSPDGVIKSGPIVVETIGGDRIQRADGFPSTVVFRLIVDTPAPHHAECRRQLRR